MQTNTSADSNPSSQSETKKLLAYARGELTFAQLEGMTWEQAKGIAQVACDLASAGRLEEARVLFEGLVEGNPLDAAAHAALGTVYHKLGRRSDALNAYEHALQSDPHNPVALVNRGELRIQAGDERGFADLLKTLEVDPEGTTAAGRRAQGLVKAITLSAVDAAKKVKAQW
ncbi:MAG: tetratricopeptide repeat protein, partial [Myxococcaceae bacterium]